VLGANETQEQSLSLVFRYADQKGLPLLDLSDLRALLSYLGSDAGKPELAGIGGLSSATVGVLLRSLTGLEDGGGNEFFGEPMLDVHDLMRVAPDGRGIISCLELPAVQDKPKLFSTTLMWLLAWATYGQRGPTTRVRGRYWPPGWPNRRRLLLPAQTALAHASRPPRSAVGRPPRTSSLLPSTRRRPAPLRGAWPR
jgi:hypothetical protein